VAHYPILIEQPAVTSDGTFAYSVGGTSNDIDTDAFYRYDPIEDTWTVLPPIPEVISSAKAVYVPETNSIYVFGNFHPDLGDTVHIYNIDTNTWSTGAPMPSGRSFPNVAYYPGNGKIYVIGGFSFDQVRTEDNQTWEYDPIANTWDTSRTPIPVPMAGSATSIV
jgi:N-acetylneuraminic acid mutarotase